MGSVRGFRRARPTFLAARFGVRSKPKPFTGVAVFDNPEQVNPLPAVDDFEGSAIDAQMLALYVWLGSEPLRGVSTFDRLRMYCGESLASLRCGTAGVHYLRWRWRG